MGKEIQVGVARGYRRVEGENELVCVCVPRVSQG